MKKPRLPTPEERTLWRETNRGTVKSGKKEKPKLEADDSHGDHSPLAVSLEREDNDTQCVVSSSPRKRPLSVSVGGQPHKATPHQNAQKHFGSPAKGELPRPAQPLEPLNAREAKRRFKPHGKPEATLDLHGMTKLEAHEKLQQFITRQHRAGRRHIAIITGKGKGGEVGVLRSNLPHWLNEPALRALISAFATALQEKGGSGVTHVLLKLPS